MVKVLACEVDKMGVHKTHTPTTHHHNHSLFFGGAKAPVLSIRVPCRLVLPDTVHCGVLGGGLEGRVRVECLEQSGLRKQSIRLTVLALASSAA